MGTDQRPRQPDRLFSQYHREQGRPIVPVSITYKSRPSRAQVITPPAVLSAMSISLRFFSSLPLEGIKLDSLYGKERKLEELRLNLCFFAA